MAPGKIEVLDNGLFYDRVSIYITGKIVEHLSNTQFGRRILKRGNNIA